jgi:hypothetical protein
MASPCRRTRIAAPDGCHSDLPTVTRINNRTQKKRRLRQSCSSAHTPQNAVHRRQQARRIQTTHHRCPHPSQAQTKPHSASRQSRAPINGHCARPLAQQENKRNQGVSARPMESGLDLRRIHPLPIAALDDEEFRRATLFAFSQIHCLQSACTATPLAEDKPVTCHYAGHPNRGW